MARASRAFSKSYTLQLNPLGSRCLRPPCGSVGATRGVWSRSAQAACAGVQQAEAVPGCSPLSQKTPTHEAAAGGPRQLLNPTPWNRKRHIWCTTSPLLTLHGPLSLPPMTVSWTRKMKTDSDQQTEAASRRSHSSFTHTCLLRTALLQPGHALPEDLQGGRGAARCASSWTPRGPRAPTACWPARP